MTDKEKIQALIDLYEKAIEKSETLDMPNFRYYLVNQGIDIGICRVMAIRRLYVGFIAKCIKQDLIHPDTTLFITPAEIVLDGKLHSISEIVNSLNFRLTYLKKIQQDYDNQTRSN